MTGGRDGPGLNAFIRSVVRTAHHLYGLEVIGVRFGFEGLLKADFITLDNLAVSDILSRGGTILKTSMKYFNFNQRTITKVKKNLKSQAIDGLIIAGGEGTARVAKKLAGAGVPLVFVPATIDNNIAGTEALGFDSVLTNLVAVIDKIKDTASSNPRIFVVELRQDEVGFQTLFLGVTSGIEWLFLPGSPPNLERLGAGLQHGIETGKNHQLVLTSSSALSSEKIALFLKKRLSLPVKSLYLEDIERGGQPTARDLILASLFGSFAVKNLLEGHTKISVGIQKNKLVRLALSRLASRRKHLPPAIIKLQKELAA